MSPVLDLCLAHGWYPTNNEWTNKRTDEWMCESRVYMRGGDAFVFLPGTFLEGIGLGRVDVPKEKHIVTIKSLSSLKLVVPATSPDPLLCYLLWPSVYSWVGKGETKKGFRNVGARAFLLLGLPLDKPSPQGRLDKSSESKLLNRVSRDTLERCWSLPPPEKESSKKRKLFSKSPG